MRIHLGYMIALWIGTLAIFVGYDVLSRRGVESIDIPKTNCVEICIKTLQSKGVFPSDFHETVAKCDLMFSAEETCKLSMRSP